MKTDKNTLELSAIFVKASTTVDGGWRVTFDLDESQAKGVMVLAQLKDMLLKLSVTQ